MFHPELLCLQSEVVWNFGLPSEIEGTFLRKPPFPTHRAKPMHFLWKTSNLVYSSSLCLKFPWLIMKEHFKNLQLGNEVFRRCFFELRSVFKFIWVVFCFSPPSSFRSSWSHRVWERIWWIWWTGSCIIWTWIIISVIVSIAGGISVAVFCSSSKICVDLLGVVLSILQTASCITVPAYSEIESLRWGCSTRSWLYRLRPM